MTDNEQKKLYVLWLRPKEDPSARPEAIRPGLFVMANNVLLTQSSQQWASPSIEWAMFSDNPSEDFFPRTAVSGWGHEAYPPVYEPCIMEVMTSPDTIEVEYYRVFYHGLMSPDYFPGVSEGVFAGVGYTVEEAIKDAVEQIEDGSSFFPSYLNAELSGIEPSVIDDVYHHVVVYKERIKFPRQAVKVTLS